MAEEARAEEMTDQLRDAFAASIRRMVADLPAHHALQLADTLCSVQNDVLAGKRITYRARNPIDADAIAEDWRRGMPLGEIVRKHQCSRSTAYKCHPNRQHRARAK